MPDFYLPYNGTNRKQKEIYLPSGGANRKQKELYAGWNGSNRKIFTGTDPVLNNNTWEQIAAASADGSASSLWSIGDEKTIEVAGEPITLQIYGFNHDNLTAGGKAGITFGLKNFSPNAARHKINATSSGVNGDFRRTSLYSWLQADLFNSLPSELRPHIKSVNKLFKIFNSGNGETASIKLFLFSEHEVLGALNKAYWWDTGLQYPIFLNEANRIKTKNGTGTGWWTMSVAAVSTSNWIVIGWRGTSDFVGLTGTNEVNFGFCI